MSLVQGFPLRQIAEDAVEPSDLYSKLMVLIVRFAYAGLIHGDFNEFNIMIKDADMEPVVIDFPQMTSTRHANAEFFFDRDVNSIRKFFRKRFRFESEEYPEYSKIMKEIAEVDATSNVTLSKSALETQARLEGNALDDRPKRFHLDQLVEASGFSRKLQEELEGVSWTTCPLGYVRFKYNLLTSFNFFTVHGRSRGRSGRERGLPE